MIKAKKRPTQEEELRRLVRRCCMDRAKSGEA